MFPNLTSGARCAGRDGKAAEPVHAGPPGMGKHLTAEPCNGRLAAWAAGGNGREFRSPLEPGSAGRGRVPSRLMSLGTQVHGRPAARAAGARESRARKGSVETTVSRDPSPWPAGSTGCRRGGPGIQTVPRHFSRREHCYFTENAVSPLLLRARAQLGWIPNV